MNWRSIAIVYGKELRDALRDRRAIIAMFVIPTVIIPVIFFGFLFVTVKVHTKAIAETPRVMIIGGEDSPVLMQALRSNERIRLVPAAPDYQQQIVDKKLRAVVEVPVGFDQALAEARPLALKIFHYAGDTKSRVGREELERFFREYRDRTIRERLTGRGLPASLVTPFEVAAHNVAPPERVSGSMFGGIIPYFVILLCFTGAMYPAMDLTAGEKERGTMETILCSPVGRTELVLGKFLTVLTGSLSTVLLAGVSAAITIPIGRWLMTNAIGSGASSGFAINTAGFFGSLVLILPVAVLFSAVIFTIALFAKSYKEAQSTVSPLIVIVIMPAMAGLLPGVELNAKLAFIPLLNVSLASKELVSGIFHWDYLGLIFGSTCVYAAAALALAVKMFNREDVIFRA